MAAARVVRAGPQMHPNAVHSFPLAASKGVLLLSWLFWLATIRWCHYQVLQLCNKHRDDVKDWQHSLVLQVLQKTCKQVPLLHTFQQSPRQILVSLLISHTRTHVWSSCQTSVTALPATHAQLAGPGPGLLLQTTSNSPLRSGFMFWKKCFSSIIKACKTQAQTLAPFCSFLFSIMCHKNNSLPFLVSSSEKSLGRWKEKIFQVSITLLNVLCLNNRSVPPSIKEVKRHSSFYFQSQT